MTDIKTILTKAIDNGASDVHINVGIPPILRKNTELIDMDFPEVTPKDVEEMISSMVDADRFKEFKQNKDLDFSTYLEDGHRFRVNAHFQRETMAISFRVIPNEIPMIEDLHLLPIVKELTDLPRGLVLVTGHTGSGKSTTLAAMIGSINMKYRKRIMTLEDPVEYALENKECMIEQREIGADCPDFASGLKHVLRQDPDIIMVGEMRDLETISFTMTAAETGHLVFSTLHTINSSQTIERIIDVYSAAQQNQIRTMLANTLQAVISQTLFKRIRENRIYEIPNIIETSRRLGMQNLDYSIAEMYSKGYIDRDEAVMRSSNPAKMEKTLVPRDVEMVQVPGSAKAKAKAKR